MFNYDTDLTLDSIMVGKETTRNKELNLDRKIASSLFDNDNVTIATIKSRTFDSEDMGSSGLYTLFGENHNTLTKMYKEYTEIEDGMGYCERCGVHMNIFNRSSYLCKNCDIDLGWDLK